MGFALGSSINLMNIFKGAISGIILGLITILIESLFMIPADKAISNRPGYAVIAMCTTAGNAMLAPKIISQIDPSWVPFVDKATTQVAASIVITAILAPIITDWYVKNRGKVTS